MRPYRAFSVLVLAVALPAAVDGSGCTPLEGDRLLGRDFAAAAPAFAGIDPEAVIALAPAPGIERHFHSAELARLASRFGLNGPTGDLPALCFKRQAAVLSREAVLAALRSALEKTGAEVELIDYYRFDVPPGRLEFAATGLTLPPAGSVRVPVVWRGRLHYSATRSLPVWARVRAWAGRERVVAAEALAAGTILEARHLRLEKTEEPPFASPGPRRPEEVAGRILRRSLAAGAAVPARYLAPAHDVQRGEEVEVEARNGTALLRFRAKAESPGRAGDAILVLNPENRRRFRAIVSGKGSVVVDPNLPAPAHAATGTHRPPRPAVVAPAAERPEGRSEP